MDSTKRKRAQKRWLLLAEALQEQKFGGNTSSLAGFQGYNLFEKRNLADDSSLAQSDSFDDVLYSLPALDLRLIVHHRRHGSRFSSEELNSFDNTGNIRVWPAEEVLAYFLCTDQEVSRILSNRSSSPRVLEVAAGMTGLASLFLAQHMSKLCSDTSFYVTDGNEQCVAHIHQLLSLNTKKEILQLQEGQLQALPLKWENTQKLWAERERSFDLIVGADCLFLEQYHQDLWQLLDFLLADDGVAILLAPSRGGSRWRFQQLAASFCFHVEEKQRYSETLWQKHVEFLDRMEEADNVYEPLNHYPTLMTIRRDHSNIKT